MAEPTRDEEREERIMMEIVVDAYGPEEQAMGWYYYLEENIEFPFKATAQLRNTDGATVPKEVNVVGLASDEEGITGKDFLLDIEAGEYINTIAFSKLSRIKASPQTKEVFAVWNYWIGR